MTRLRGLVRRGRRSPPRAARVRDGGPATPSVVVLAGPNGAGKTTASQHLLRGTLAVREFVNADAIARGLSGFAPEDAALPAGRIMLQRMHALAAQRADFAFETTLASRSFAPWLRRLRSEGFCVHLLFLWLPSAEQALARVARRVQQGGHDVPRETVVRRYHAGIHNFVHLYRPLAHSWSVLDNTHGMLLPIANGSDSSGGGDEPAVADAAAWRMILAHG